MVKILGFWAKTSFGIYEYSMYIFKIDLSIEVYIHNDCSCAN